MNSNTVPPSPYPSYMPPHSNPSAMQLVPYVGAAPAADKPVPLTPEQLTKLYNMNKQPTYSTAAPPIPNYSSYPNAFIPPSIGFNVPQSNYRPTHYVPPPQQPAPIYYPSAAASPTPTPSMYGTAQQTAFLSQQQQPFPRRDFQTPSPNTTARPFDLSSYALPKSKSDVTLRKKSEAGRKSNTDDLIDLDNDDKYDR
jgi:hypothetical protein